MSAVPRDKSFFIRAVAPSENVFASVEASMDDVNFNPLFLIEGRLFLSRGDVVRADGLYKSVRGRVYGTSGSGNGSGLTVELLADPSCC